MTQDSMLRGEEYREMWKQYNLSLSDSISQELKNRFKDTPRITDRCNGGYESVNQYWHHTTGCSGDFYCDYCYSNNCHDKENTSDEAVKLFQGHCMCKVHSFVPKDSVLCEKCDKEKGSKSLTRLCSVCRRFAVYNEAHQYCDSCCPAGLCKCGANLPDGKNICITCPGSYTVCNVKMYKIGSSYAASRYCSFCYSEGCYGEYAKKYPHNTNTNMNIEEVNLPFARCDCSTHGSSITKPKVLYCEGHPQMVIVNAKEVCANCKYYTVDNNIKNGKLCLFCAEKLELCPCGAPHYSINYVTESNIKVGRIHTKMEYFEHFIESGNIDMTILNIFPEFLDIYANYISLTTKKFYEKFGDTEYVQKCSPLEKKLKINAEKLTYIKNIINSLDQRSIYPKISSSRRYYNDFSTEFIDFSAIPAANISEQLMELFHSQTAQKRCFFEIRTVKMAEDVEVEFWITSSDLQYNLLNSLLIDENALDLKSILFHCSNIRDKIDPCQVIANIVREKNDSKVEFTSPILLSNDARSPIIQENILKLLCANSKMVYGSYSYLYYELFLIFYQIIIDYITNLPGVKIDDYGVYECLPHPLNMGYLENDFMEQFLSTNIHKYTQLFNMSITADLSNTLRSLVTKVGLLSSMPYEIPKEENSEQDRGTGGGSKATKQGYMFHPLFKRCDDRTLCCNREVTINIRPGKYVYNVYELYFKIISIMARKMYQSQLLLYDDRMITFIPALGFPYQIMQNIKESISVKFLAVAKKQYETAIAGLVNSLSKELSDFITITCNKCNKYINSSMHKENDNKFKDLPESPECDCGDELPYEEYKKREQEISQQKSYENIKENFGEEYANKHFKKNK